MAFAGWQPRALEEGRFRARLNDGRSAHITIATHAQPSRHRRPMAFQRLAKALGCTAALPETHTWRVTIPQLHAALAHHQPLFARLSPRLSVDHDGTIPCLVEFFPAAAETATTAREQTASAAHSADHSATAKRLQQLAASEAVVPSAEARLVDTWVCLQSLDYIAGYGRRRHWFVAPSSGQITGRDNEAVFRPYINAATLEPLRQRLAATRHFPASLLLALRTTDAPELVAQLAAKTFVDEALGPRQRADVVDRIKTLQSLVRTRKGDVQRTF